MKKLYTLALLTIFLFLTLSTQAQVKIIKVWPGKIPNSIINKTYKEQDLTYKNGIYRIKRVKVPTLMIFTPQNGNGSAVVICPGGGYGHLAYAKEGVDIAKRFNKMGVMAFILKYRLPSDSIMKNKSIGPLQDAQEAVRIVRRNSKEWKINPEKIGVIGFSAGGSLASLLCTHYNDKIYNCDFTSAKPDFSILLYPVISMKEEITHMGSRKNLLGVKPSEKEIKYFSSELNVRPDTPPAFLALAENDKTVPIQNSIDYFLALKKYDIPAELHIFQSGGHGFGLGKKGETESYWPVLVKNWLKSIKIL
jgi:acetyl esterase/lipase